MIPIPLHSVYSVHSVVKKWNHGLHRMLRKGEAVASCSSCTHSALHSVYSVLSVVKNWNHGLHRMLGVGVLKGGLGKMHQLFGDEMDTLIDELNRELVA